MNKPTRSSRSRTAQAAARPRRRVPNPFPPATRRLAKRLLQFAGLPEPERTRAYNAWLNSAGSPTRNAARRQRVREFYSLMQAIAKKLSPRDRASLRAWATRFSPKPPARPPPKADVKQEVAGPRQVCGRVSAEQGEADAPGFEPFLGGDVVPEIIAEAEFPVVCVFDGGPAAVGGKFACGRVDADGRDLGGSRVAEERDWPLRRGLCVIGWLPSRGGPGRGNGRSRAARSLQRIYDLRRHFVRDLK